MSRRRIAALAILLALLAGLGTLLWSALDGPPPGLILAYGLPPAGGPTGRTWTNDAGIEFVEIAPGYRRVRRRIVHEEGDWLGRLGESIGLRIGSPPLRDPEFIDRWVEVDRAYWISWTPVSEHLLVAEPAIPGVVDPRIEFREDAPGTIEYRLPSEDEVWLACESGAIWNIEEYEAESFVTDYTGRNVRTLPLGPGWDAEEPSKEQVGIEWLMIGLRPLWGGNPPQVRVQTRLVRVLPAE